MCDLRTQGKLWEARNEAELNDNNAAWWENIKTAIPECKSLDKRTLLWDPVIRDQGPRYKGPRY